MEYDQAIQIFYNSQTFDKLMDVETGLYLESSAYVYGMFLDERNFGSFVQTRISPKHRQERPLYQSRKKD